MARARKLISKLAKSKTGKALKGVGVGAFRVAKVAGKIAGGSTLLKAGLVTAGAGLVTKGAIALGKKVFGRKDGAPKKRRSLVPKAVKKYVSRMSRRRDQEEKVLKKVIKGAGLMPKAKKISPGVITQEEMLRALKR